MPEATLRPPASANAAAGQPLIDHIEACLGVLSLEQKVGLLSGAGFWTTRAIPEIGLTPMVLSDGPAGVRGLTWTERDPSAALPNATAIAATFDPAAAERAGVIIGDEARRKGVHVVLGPTVNLHRSPLAGRNFESFGEDPMLSGMIAAAVVRGIQSRRVAATVKHFIANDSETERLDVDVIVDDHTLRTVYAAPFAAAVEAGAWAVISSYNSINGVTGTESPLLNEMLRGELGFDGVVVSDWDALRSVQAGAEAGTDLAMPGPDTAWSGGLLAAVRGGLVSEAAIDQKVANLLLLAARVGALETDSMEPVTGGFDPDHDLAAAYDPRQLERELISLACQGAVLVKNRDATLPLGASDAVSLAVIGAGAHRTRIGGGGSATVIPTHVVSFLDGIQAAYPQHQVRYAPGCDPYELLEPLDSQSSSAAGGPGLEVTFFDRADQVIGSEIRDTGELVYGLGFPDGIDEELVHHIEVVARVTEPGTRQLSYAGVGMFTLELDGECISKRELRLEGADPIAALTFPPQHVATVELPNREVVIKLTYVPEPESIVALQLGFAQPKPSREEMLRDAQAAAADSDVAIVVVSTTAGDESEGFDRTTLQLPGDQDELVWAVTRVARRTIVVVNAGASVAMPWRDAVDAIIVAHFPGQYAGTALGDLLTGDSEPGGRLPATWYRDDSSEFPRTIPLNGTLEYSEGPRFGYRAVSPKEEIAFPFGHGLGYTEWSRGAAVVERSADALSVRLTIENTGGREGAQIVQVYSGVAQGLRGAGDTGLRFLGAQRVVVEAGAAAECLVTMPMSHVQRVLGEVPDDLSLRVGFSSADLDQVVVAGGDVSVMGR